MRQSRSLSIQVSSPLLVDNVFLFSIEGVQEFYTQTINAIGGFWNATFRIKLRQPQIEDWLLNGIGRQIKTYDHAQQLIWKGFVNRVAINLGPLSVSRGPLLDIANRVSLIYSTVDTTTTPPTFGVRAKTDTVNDTNSQALYGILERILSSGGVTPDEANQIRDTFLEENKDPATSQEISLGGGGEPSVTVECLGDVHWLRTYPYNQTTTTGLIDLSGTSGKLQDILSSDPNSVISTDFSDMVDNTLQVRAWENNDTLAWDEVKALVAQGDVSDNRYLFGIYANQRARYEQAPTTLAYQQKVTDPELRIETLSGSRVLPWNVLPGRWLFVSDFLVGQTIPSSLRLDPRAIFIESVTYTAPWGLTLRGGKTDTLPQTIAKLGLGGVGA